MKLKHYLFSPVVVVIVMMMIAGLVFYALYTETKKNCLDKLEHSFTSAIHQEKEKRMDRGHLFFSHDVSDTPVDQIIIQQEKDTIVLKKPDAIKDMIIDGKRTHADHSYLFFKKKFVDLHRLDSILQIELQKHNILAQTAIAYTDHINDTTCYSSDDSSLYRSTWCTPPITLGIRGEITLQGFARPKVLSIIGKDSKSFAIVFIAWVITTGMILFFTFLNKKRVPVTVQLTGNQCQITGDILLDADQRLIVYHGSEIKLTKQLFTLFESLWTRPDHYASYEYLAYTLFESKDLAKVENRLAKSVHRLREVIQDIPELEIDNMPNQGYRILFKNEIEPSAINF